MIDVECADMAARALPIVGSQVQNRVVLKRLLILA